MRGLLHHIFNCHLVVRQRDRFRKSSYESFQRLSGLVSRSLNRRACSAGVMCRVIGSGKLTRPAP